MKFDLIVVGTGAGLIVLDEAARRGLNCAIVEKDKFGGTCLTRGCIPSKMLVYPADFIREAQSSGRFGVDVGAPKIDWDVISRRMWEQIDFSVELEGYFSHLGNVKVFRGTGAFTGTHTMAVQYDDGRPDDLIEGEKFVIGAGARSQVLHIPGLEEAGYLTSETFFGKKFPQKPWESLVIVGSGAISVEFAHIFSAFGTKVTMLARSGRILTKEEPEIARFMQAQLTHYGVDVRTNTVPVSVELRSGKRIVAVENRAANTAEIIECDEILMASGVRSNGDLLRLDKAGIEVNERGWIATNGFLETSQPHIWALGDINGKHQFRHMANYEAEILAHNLFERGEKREVSYDVVPSVVFAHPQVAHVGRTERELADAGVPHRIARSRYSEVVAARAMGYREDDDDNGFVKMIVGEDERILGVHIVGPQAAVLLQPFVHLMNAGRKFDAALAGAKHPAELQPLRELGTYGLVNDSIVPHPALSELTAWIFEKFESGHGE